ncbi:MAG: FUSC family protein [Pseudomonadota bacterium]
MNEFHKHFFGTLARDFSDLSLDHPTVRLALKTALATIIACFVALFIHAQQPYWAGISAFIVMHNTAGSTIFTSIMRVIGTVSGAALGVLLVGFMVNHSPLFLLVIAIVTFFGNYLTTFSKRYAYAWIFVYVTALLVLIGALENPQPQSFIELAFFRSFEITIGIIVGSLVSATIFSEFARDEVDTALAQATRRLESLAHVLFDSFTSSVIRDEQKEFDRQARSLADAMVKLEDLLDLAAHESGRYSKAYLDQSQAMALRRITEILVYCYRENIPMLNHTRMSDSSRATFKAFKTLLLDVLNELRTNTNAGARNEHIASSMSEMRLLVQQLANDCHAHPGDRLFEFQIVYYFDLLIEELGLLIEPPPPTGTTSARTSTPRGQMRLFAGLYFDSYNVRFAAAGTIAVLTVPFIWLYFDLPGYSQIVISIAACITLTTVASQRKGALRLYGCLIGSTIVLFLLWLDIESLPVMLACLFLAVFALSLIQFGDQSISYFGAQAVIVILLGLVSDLYPTQSIQPPLERLLGVFLGVISIIGFLRLFLPAEPRDYLVHLIGQANHAADDICQWLFEQPDTVPSRPDHWQHRRLMTQMTVAVRALEAAVADAPSDTDMAASIKEIVANERSLLHCLYAYALSRSGLPSGSECDAEIVDTFRREVAAYLRHPQSADASKVTMVIDERASLYKTRFAGDAPVAPLSEVESQQLVRDISLIRIARHHLRARALAEDFRLQNRAEPVANMASEMGSR